MSVILIQPEKIHELTARLHSMLDDKRSLIHPSIQAFADHAKQQFPYNDSKEGIIKSMTHLLLQRNLEAFIDEYSKNQSESSPIKSITQDFQTLVNDSMSKIASITPKQVSLKQLHGNFLATLNNINYSISEDVIFSDIMKSLNKQIMNDHNKPFLNSLEQFSSAYIRLSNYGERLLGEYRPMKVLSDLLKFELRNETVQGINILSMIAMELNRSPINQVQMRLPNINDKSTLDTSAIIDMKYLANDTRLLKPEVNDVFIVHKYLDNLKDKLEQVPVENITSLSTTRKHFTEEDKSKLCETIEQMSDKLASLYLQNQSIFKHSFQEMLGFKSQNKEHQTELTN